jgi:potassium-transporting ATPase potassium-binding subunit
MTTIGILQIATFVALIALVTRPVGRYLYRVFEGTPPALLASLERALYRLSGIDPAREQTWLQYACALLLFSAAGTLATYALLRLQHLLPLNPQGFGPVAPDLAFDTAASFSTNTNWQSYGGESTLSYLSQMAALATQNFTSAATGLGAALALARGLTRKAGPSGARTLGNFWVDQIRAVVHVLLPASLVLALIFVALGCVQTLAPSLEVGTLEGARQLLARGPVASQEAIKLLGINGGGFFNANSAHPFENPTPLSNLLQMIAMLALPAGLTWTYGRMAGDQKQGWALFAAMAGLLAAGAVATYAAEAQPNPALAGLAVDQSAGNLEGKELRFGVAGSALFAAITTDASCGAVNAAHDSFNALGGLVPLVNIQLGELVFGGVGSGLYAMLIYALLTVFIAGLMVGRTPEYLGKKIEARELKLAMLYALLAPLFILGFSAWAAVSPGALASLGNAGPHGLSEVLYAYASATGNNGSAFGGLNANTPFWNITLGLAMLAGRFLMVVPVLALGGSMVAKKVAAPGPGTFPTSGPLFTALLVAVIVVVGALTFLPALTLGPIAEHLVARTGEVF